MIRILFLSVVFILLKLNISFSSEKIVFIDLNYIFKNSVAGKDLNIQITEKTNVLNKKVQEFKKQLDEKQKNLLSQKNILSEEKYNINIKELEDKVKEINQLVNKEKKELSFFKNRVEKEFFKNLNSIIQKYSNDNSIGIILKKKDLLMAKKNLNITQDILKIFDEKVEKITIN